MSILRYGARTGGCAVLGPGRRAVLWVYGCCFSCLGCVAESFKTGPWKEASAEDMAGWILEQETDGLTISGGEPMLQAQALAEMVEHIRRVRDCGIIVYTGFLYEDLLKKPEVQPFLNQIDLLIDGPYRQELDKNQPCRGSENQRLLPLTGRYLQALDTYYRGGHGRSIEILLSEDQTLFAGVPSREQVAIWENIIRMGEKR